MHIYDKEFEKHDCKTADLAAVPYEELAYLEQVIVNHTDQILSLLLPEMKKVTVLQIVDSLNANSACLQTPGAWYPETDTIIVNRKCIQSLKEYVAALISIYVNWVENESSNDNGVNELLQNKLTELAEKCILASNDKTTVVSFPDLDIDLTAYDNQFLIAGISSLDELVTPQIICDLKNELLNKYKSCILGGEAFNDFLTDLEYEGICIDIPEDVCPDVNMLPRYLFRDDKADCRTIQIRKTVYKIAEELDRCPLPMEVFSRMECSRGTLEEKLCFMETLAYQQAQNYMKWLLVNQGLSKSQLIGRVENHQSFGKIVKRFMDRTDFSLRDEIQGKVLVVAEAFPYNLLFDVFGIKRDRFTVKMTEMLLPHIDIGLDSLKEGEEVLIRLIYQHGATLSNIIHLYGLDDNEFTQAVFRRQLEKRKETILRKLRRPVRSRYIKPYLDILDMSVWEKDSVVDKKQCYESFERSVALSLYSDMNSGESLISALSKFYSREVVEYFDRTKYDWLTKELPVDKGEFHKLVDYRWIRIADLKLSVFAKKALETAGIRSLYDALAVHGFENSFDSLNDSGLLDRLKSLEILEEVIDVLKNYNKKLVWSKASFFSIVEMAEKLSCKRGTTLIETFVPCIVLPPLWQIGIRTVEDLLAEYAESVESLLNTIHRQKQYIELNDKDKLVVDLTLKMMVNGIEGQYMLKRVDDSLMN